MKLLTFAFVSRPAVETTTSPALVAMRRSVPGIAVTLPYRVTHSVTMAIRALHDVKF